MSDGIDRRYSKMLRLFLTHSLRYFARHPALTALNIVGIALGVTVFLSIQIVNHSALESFRASVDIVAVGAHSRPQPAAHSGH